MYHQASPPKEHSEDTDFIFSEDLFSFLDQYRSLIPEFQSLLRWVVTNGDLLPRLLPAEHIPRSTLDELTLSSQSGKIPCSWYWRSVPSI